MDNYQSNFTSSERVVSQLLRSSITLLPFEVHTDDVVQ